MKNSNQERLGRLMKQYHRNCENQWTWDRGINFSPSYSYSETKTLSKSDEVGFILNDRRVMVFWIHPRVKYSAAIHKIARSEAGESPVDPADLFNCSEKRWKRQGRSRKKLAFCVLDPWPESQREYYSKIEAIESRLDIEGIDFVVRPSISVRRLAWCTCVDLCMPFEVRSKEEARALALFARRLIKGETALAKEFPGYEYGRTEWLAEAGLRSEDRKRPDNMA